MNGHLLLFVDGMSETTTELTSLERARTPTFDRIFSQGESGFYQPVIGIRATEPKTDVVIPAFWGLSPEQHPGRTYLELVDMGAEPSISTHFAALKWPESELTQIALGQARTLALRQRTEVERELRDSNLGSLTMHWSPFMNLGAKLLLSIDGEQSALELQSKLLLLCKDLPGQPVIDEICQSGPQRILPPLGRDRHFLGWAKGSLRGALKKLGFECNPFERQLGDYGNWSRYSDNFETYIKSQVLAHRSDDFVQFLLYTKETAFAGRRGDQASKIKAIEYMDSFLGRLIPLLDLSTRVAVLSDHSSDIGGERNPSANTIYCTALVADLAGPSRLRHYCEGNVMLSKPVSISQESLQRSLDMPSA